VGQEIGSQEVEMNVVGGPEDESKLFPWLAPFTTFDFVGWVE